MIVIATKCHVFHFFGRTGDEVAKVIDASVGVEMIFFFFFGHSMNKGQSDTRRKLQFSMKFFECANPYSSTNMLLIFGR